ncbi:uncharacterized protein LOC115663029 [Syzygium oleosum]|uniref:uncharacterized protein LOC115663029 n=1 Tax=Syzygium oleosum TaxID=219896 RepID=UPI0024B97913|nr:uncharacterized protein LOC115663029 [Syzygium oleosum]
MGFEKNLRRRENIRQDSHSTVAKNEYPSVRHVSPGPTRSDLQYFENIAPLSSHLSHSRAPTPLSPPGSELGAPSDSSDAGASASASDADADADADAPLRARAPNFSLLPDVPPPTPLHSENSRSLRHRLRRPRRRLRRPLCPQPLPTPSPNPCRCLRVGHALALASASTLCIRRPRRSDGGRRSRSQRRSSTTTSCSRRRRRPSLRRRRRRWPGRRGRSSSTRSTRSTPGGSPSSKSSTTGWPTTTSSGVLSLAGCLQREIVLSMHEILALKRNTVARSMPVQGPFLATDASSESATTSLNYRSGNEAVQKSNEMTVDSSISIKRRSKVPSHTSTAQKTDGSPGSQPIVIRKPTEKAPFSGKHIPQRPPVAS